MVMDGLEKNNKGSGNIVITFGLTDEENEAVRLAMPNKGAELFITDVVTDVLAHYAEVIIINAESMDSDSKELLFSYYSDVGESSDELVLWLGDPLPPKDIRGRFKCYAGFDALKNDLKYVLLEAFRKSRNIKAFSERMEKCLMILMLIRKHPGIKTQELADKTESTVRTVQRYISTLQAAGEWIDYDKAKKGWVLLDGCSVFFGDVYK